LAKHAVHSRCANLTMNSLDISCGKQDRWSCLRPTVTGNQPLLPSKLHSVQSGKPSRFTLTTAFRVIKTLPPSTIAPLRRTAYCDPALSLFKIYVASFQKF